MRAFYSSSRKIPRKVFILILTSQDVLLDRELFLYQLQLQYLLARQK
jgi:hypothetical protein